MLDTTQQSFTVDVLEASRQAPVLVDFWAPWCGPCRTLSPVLAAAEAEYQGRLKVVKLNVDENQELAARFGVRSIPYVVAFVDGQAVDSFVGVLPAEALRQFISRLLPDPAEIERRKAQQLLAGGDTLPSPSIRNATPPGWTWPSSFWSIRPTTAASMKRRRTSPAFLRRASWSRAGSH